MQILAKFRIGILLAVLAMLPLAARAQNAPATSPPCDSACAAHPAAMSGMTMGGMDHMDMAMCTRMMAAGDARLDSLVTAMHSATGGARIGAMQLVIDEMLVQRKDMHEHIVHMMSMMSMPARPDSMQH